MNIVFNVNPLGLEGLGATIVSMLQNCQDDSQLKIYVLCSRLRNKDKRNLRLLLRAENFRGQYEFIDYDANKAFGHLRDFSGDYTTYGKLLISRLVPENVVLYLDSDLIVEVDVLELKNFDFAGKTIAAVSGSTVKHSLDRQFMIQKLSWHEETPYFNAGIILFNLDHWRKQGMDEKWGLLTRKHPGDFISHDQTILNSLCQGDFARLPTKFNVIWPPGGNYKEGTDRITHFVGCPKPWDTLGKHIHSGHVLWRKYSSPLWDRCFPPLSVPRIRRSWNIRRSLAKHLLGSIKKNTSL